MRSPRTGALSVPGPKRPDVDPALVAHIPPAPRVLTEKVATTLRSEDADSSATPPRPAATLPQVRLGDQRRSDLLQTAWDDSDVDALAAQGEVDTPSALAAFVLAGHLGRKVGDPRAHHWLYRAVLTGEDPATDPLLNPYRDQVRFPAQFPRWGITEDLPCAREGLGVSVAAEEIASGDLDAAYGVLLDLAETDLVRTLRALVAVELKWWARAEMPGAAKGRWAAPMRFAQGAAASARSDYRRALPHLDTAIAELTDGQEVSHPLRDRALLLRADCHRHLGDVDAAWEDLTQLLRLVPGHPGATEALKSL